jgi:hypothetical protein
VNRIVQEEVERQCMGRNWGINAISASASSTCAAVCKVAQQAESDKTVKKDMPWQQSLQHL